MKAKDVKRPKDKSGGLSILRINKAEAQQPTGSGSPPTESPPPPLADPAPAGRPPATATAPTGGHHGGAPHQEEEADLPSYTPRSVDDVDFDEEAFQAALEGSASMGAKGEEVCGTVIGHESDGVYVDIGGKAPGWMPRQECGFGVVTDVAERFPLGQPLKVLVTGEQNAEGMVTVSCRALMARDRWATLTRLAQEAAVVQTVITGFNRGGCTCQVEGLRGFIPRSQLVDGDNPGDLVGKTVGVTFLEVNPRTSKLVLSEKQASRAQHFAELKVGDLVTGRISGVKPFGCFVDLGPVSGLLHQRSISGSYVRDLREVFDLGDTVSALVTDVDAARGRIALNTALLENMAGEMLVAKAEVMGQAQQRAERARSLLFQEQPQEQDQPRGQEQGQEAPAPISGNRPPLAAAPPRKTAAPSPHPDSSPAPDLPPPAPVLVSPRRPGAPLPGDDSSE